ncbi:MAG: DUF2652 domain-containing protein [Gaiellaceae bacterium]
MSAESAGDRALLVLADIRGYTRFMRLHRMNLAHSQDITRRLLEAVVDAAPELELVEIEGDAAFLYRVHAERDDPAPGSALPLTLAMHQAFHSRQQWMIDRNICACEACQQIGRLQIKFVAHVGEIASQTIRGRTKIVGVDVIAVHRMLKNPVSVPEYMLISESLYEQCEPELRAQAVRVELELEGLGSMTSYFVDLGTVALAVPQLPQPTLLSRFRETAGVGLRCFPRVVGIRRLQERVELR